MATMVTADQPSPLYGTTTLEPDEFGNKIPLAGTTRTKEVITDKTTKIKKNRFAQR